tara:strand:- start:2641 stop:3354 length:714 start_codon:yes stop_codon:yes gene_type:complete
MSYKYFCLFLIMFITSLANGQYGPIDDSANNPAIDLEHFESLISKSELVFLGDLKAISRIRRVADRIIPGPWVVTQYFMEIEKVVLWPPNEAASETISFVSYGGDLTLQNKIGAESGTENKGIAQSGVDSSGYKGVFERFGRSESISHTAGISQTGRYLIFILSSQVRSVFDDARLLSVYRVSQVSGKHVVEVGGKIGKVDYADLESELKSRADLLGSYDFDARRNRPGTLHIGRQK